MVESCHRGETARASHLRGSYPPDVRQPRTFVPLENVNHLIF